MGHLRALLRRLRWIPYHIDLGLCSGFPPCCIAFFTFIWASNRPWAGWRGRYARWMHRVHPPHGPGYVPCPLCLISGARVRVHTCTDDCRARHRLRRPPTDHDP